MPKVKVMGYRSLVVKIVEVVEIVEMVNSAHKSWLTAYKDKTPE